MYQVLKSKSNCELQTLKDNWIQLLRECESISCVFGKIIWKLLIDQSFEIKHYLKFNIMIPCFYNQWNFLQIKQSEWKPDYGPAEFLPTWGATIAGARKFLIAYNINILGTKEQAHRLALNLRTQGRGPDQVRCQAYMIDLVISIYRMMWPSPKVELLIAIIINHKGKRGFGSLVWWYQELKN